MTINRGLFLGGSIRMRTFHSFRLLTGIFALTLVHADEGSAPEVAIQAPEVPSAVLQVSSAPALPALSEIVAEAPRAPVVHPFSAFTGKIRGKKVRLRVSADLEGRVVREMSRGDLLSIVGEKGDFFAVEPPAGTKAYVFRSFVLDGIVEGSRVNVRLEPSLDAPVIGHLNSGDRIQGALSATHNKWYEIKAPADAHFYVAKEFVEHAGGPELKAQLDRKRVSAEQLLDAATLLSKAEMRKSFPEVDFARIQKGYDVVISDYSEFTDLTDKAKEALSSFNETYLEKKISFLEEKAGISSGHNESQEGSMFSEAFTPPTDRMKIWETPEETLYLSWATQNEDRSIDEFYDEQKQASVTISGIVEAYTTPVKRRPGDFLLRDQGLPVAYLYSTQVDLQQFVGKKVTVAVAPRDNHNFAFPAYYVLAVE
jgi:hypothetical protein